MQIADMSRSEIAEIQRKLTDLGFGSLVPDGIWGPQTARAYESYLGAMPVSMRVAPPADKPWWTSTALLGGLVSVVAWGASLAGFEFDVASAKESIPEIIGAIFAVIALVGTWRRKAPIDPTLVVPGVRIPSRPRGLRDSSVQASAPWPRQPSRPESRDPRGNFGDHH
ncbi:MAG: peptidoglycan-binding protein [Chloroflexia bacterium]|nr:peptidoglycan-binding protein [Chloroflexia bacterium]